MKGGDKSNRYGKERDLNDINIIERYQKYYRDLKDIKSIIHIKSIMVISIYYFSPKIDGCYLETLKLSEFNEHIKIGGLKKAKVCKQEVTIKVPQPRMFNITIKSWRIRTLVCCVVGGRLLLGERLGCHMKEVLSFLHDSFVYQLMYTAKYLLFSNKQ